VGVQPAEGAADGGLGGDQEAAGEWVVAGAERGPDWLGVAAAAGRSRVGDGGQVGEQVRGLGFLERVGIAQRVKTRWDRG
jgi:hypothetical protein